MSQRLYFRHGNPHLPHPVDRKDSNPSRMLGALLIVLLLVLVGAIYGLYRLIGG